MVTENRTSRTTLAHLVNRLNIITRSPSSMFNTDVSNRSNVGHFHLDYAACYGGYRLCRVTNEQGGATDISNHKRMNIKEMISFIQGMIAMLYEVEK